MVRKRCKNVDGRRIACFGCMPADDPPVACTRAFCSARTDLPARVDLRPHCTPVEDQARSNSCAANAAAGAYEYLMNKWAQANGEESSDVSRLFIYFIGRRQDLCKRGREQCKVKDQGMTLSGAMDAMHSKGACRQDLWPFEVDMMNQKPPEEAYDNAMGFKISESDSVAVDVATMKGALADGYPIITGLKLTKAFFRPGKSGKIATPDPDDPQSASHGLHAMLIVGYSDKHEVFIYRNSWGEDWGDCGYGYVPYSYAANPEFNFCGQYVVQGVTELDMTPDDVDDEEDMFYENEDEADDWEEVEDDEDEDDGDPEEDEEDPDYDPEEFSLLRELFKVFRHFDHDGSGQLGTWELMAALNMMGKFVWPWQVDEYIQAYDQDGTGNLGFDGFCGILGVDVP